MWIGTIDPYGWMSPAERRAVLAHPLVGKSFSFPRPVDADFAWINQGGASVAQNEAGAILLTAPAGAGTNLRIRKKAAPATPYTITACLTVAFTPPAALEYPQAGLCWREVATGEVVVFSVYADGDNSGRLVGNLYKYDSPTAGNSAYTPDAFLPESLAFGMGLWLRLKDDGVNREVYWSPNGIDFQLWHQVVRTDHLTADEVGFFAESGDADVSALLRLHSWEQA